MKLLFASRFCLVQDTISHGQAIEITHRMTFTKSSYTHCFRSVRKMQISHVFLLVISLLLKISLLNFGIANSKVAAAALIWHLLLFMYW